MLVLPDRRDHLHLLQRRVAEFPIERPGALDRLELAQAAQHPLADRIGHRQRAAVAHRRHQAGGERRIGGRGPPRCWSETRSASRQAPIRASKEVPRVRSEVGAAAKRIWFSTSTEVTPTADAALAACLMPAMRDGGTLTMTDPVGERMLRGLREFEAIQRAWSLDWEFGDPPLEEVEVIAPVRKDEHAPRSDRVGAFFSAASTPGPPSWTTTTSPT